MLKKAWAAVRQRLAGSSFRLCCPPYICWGSKKLFKAQYHLEINGYANHEEWLEDWRLHRGGNFYSIGKGSVDGNNPVTKIHHQAERTFPREPRNQHAHREEDDIFTVTITVPRC